MQPRDIHRLRPQPPGLPCVLALLALPSGEAPVTIERRLGIMGTQLSMKVEAESREQALASSEAAVRALETVEARLSTWRETSELSRLNRTAVGQACAITPELAHDLGHVRRWWRDTDGAFDPSIGALARVLGLRTGGRVPSAAELADARVPGGFASLELNATNATRRHDALYLDEGGFGKGIGLDAAITALVSSGASAGELDLGGHVALHGVRQRSFMLADPRDRALAVIAIDVKHGSFSTTGNSEHAVVAGGQRIGHILDPRTGAPAEDFGSVTVWAPDATAADCLSTGLFVLGPERALAWAREHPDIEVLIVEIEGEQLRARASSGWRERVRALDARVRLDVDDRAHARAGPSGQ